MTGAHPSKGRATDANGWARTSLGEAPGKSSKPPRERRGVERERAGTEEAAQMGKGHSFEKGGIDVRSYTPAVSELRRFHTQMNTRFKRGFAAASDRERKALSQALMGQRKTMRVNRMG